MKGVPFERSQRMSLRIDTRGGLAAKSFARWFPTVGGMIKVVAGTIGVVAFCDHAFAANTPTVKETMAFTPKQKDVEYETPRPDEYAKCKVELERKGKASGWVVLGSAGQVLRKFLDTDGDNKLDQWRYYNHGIEVYRDIDSNDNDKVDQSRWLNLGGSRWGIDQNEDGHIDGWRVLSAAEATKEAIRAMTTGDDPALQAVMINAEDLKSLGVNQAMATKLLESAADAVKKSRSVVSKSKVLSSQARWSRFDAQMPGVIPADDEKANGDLHVYENAMAIVENQGKFAAVQIGEMIRVGEVWKLTQLPQPIEGENGSITTAGGVLMQPLLAAASTDGQPAGASPEVEKILGELVKIEQGLMQPTADRSAVKGLMSRRGELLKKAIELAMTDDERLLLSKQLVDGYALASQVGSYPEGASDLKVMETDLRRRSPKSPLVSYVAYRRIQAQYYVDLHEAEKEKERAAEVQKEWVKNLEEFTKEFPESEDSSDAMLLLAHHEELSGHSKEAIEWYQRLAREKAKSEAGQRAVGALRRLDLAEKQLVLSGPSLDGGTIDIRSLKGRTVLVVYWASEYKVCEEDLPQLRALYAENRSKGFEIVGVCLDSDKANIKPYLSQHKMSWPQIYQPGGLNSPPALAYGVISLPTMFLVNAEGVVVSRSATVTDVKAALPSLLAGKPLPRK